MINEKEVIPFEPEWTIFNSKDCRDKLIKLMKDILGSTNVHQIQVKGTDVQDGKQWRTFEISINGKEIVVNKEFRP